TGPGKGAIKSVDIRPCTAEPCKLKRGTDITMVVIFVAGGNATKATSVVHGIIGGVPIPFPLPHPDACTGASPLPCPLSAGTQYTYTSTLSILQSYPT
ncbi:NPC intracellular cholesterol transporter 2-like, partial [Saccoglossus kowalevskii]